MLYAPDFYSFPSEKLIGDADFFLFGNAKISERFVSANPPCHPDSRKYVLRKRTPKEDPLWESVYSLFAVLKLGKGYVFEIHGQSIIGCGLYSKRGKSLYIPKNSDGTIHALTYVAGLFIRQINKQNGQEHTGLDDSALEALIIYARRDLETGEIWKHNMKAGQTADALMGF